MLHVPYHVLIINFLTRDEDMNTEKIIDRLRGELPPTFTRRTASLALGGALSAGTMANLDCRGQGPGGVLLGRTILYEREAFLKWLENRIQLPEGSE
jgi:hypothetical protein